MPPIIPKYVRRHVRDSLLYLLILSGLLSIAVGLYKGGLHLATLEAQRLTLIDLPWALTLSFMRMLASYVACVFFAFGLGLLAARSKYGERIILPFLDIMQSVPVIGFFPAAISFFIGITQGHRIGVELAACFLIFTSQAWNMAFAVYEATKTIPQDNLDAVASYGVRGSQRFWRLYAPAAVPRLVYNSILSWSNGWYFLVACEIIAVGPVQYHLPGIGSFLATAAEQSQVHLVVWGLISLTTLILTLDAMVWRPASNWAERFRQDQGVAPSTTVRTGRFTIPVPFESLRFILLPLAIATRKVMRALWIPTAWLARDVLMPLIWDLPAAIIRHMWLRIYSHWAIPAWDRWQKLLKRLDWLKLILLWSGGTVVGFAASKFLIRWLKPPYPPIAKEIPLAILASTGRLILTLGISMAIVLPVILFVWNRPKWRTWLTTLSQVGASLPAVALFPLIILILVRKFGGGMESASILLLLTGMIWYVMFNGLGGAAIIPGDLAEATRSLGLGSMATFKRLVLPAIRPSLITGAITAWGGGWNALVVAEYVTQQGKVLSVNGIGALLNRAVYELGDTRSIVICIAALVGWVILINALVWRPLYQSAAERFRLD